MKLNLLFPIVKPIALGCGLTLLGLEILLRLLPVSNGLNFNSNNIKKPVLTSNATSIIHSLGWKMEQPQIRRVNNYGFVDDRDYQSNAVPIAVIGDSYIESAMLPYESTLQNYLNQKLIHKPPVYSYGVPGYALSGYIGTAEYATRVFKPQAFVFLLTNGDIQDSLKMNRGSYYLDLHSQELRFVDAKPGFTSKVLENSSLLRYVVRHLRIDPGALRKIGQKQQPELKLSSIQLRKTAEILLHHLTQKSSVNPENTIFILDSDRESIYGQKSIDSYQDLAIFKEVAQAHGYRVIDTYPVFNRYYKSTYKRLDFSPVDAHWTGETHALVADTVFTYLSTILTRQQQKQKTPLTRISTPTPHNQQAR